LRAAAVEDDETVVGRQHVLDKIDDDKTFASPIALIGGARGKLGRLVGDDPGRFARRNDRPQRVADAPGPVRADQAHQQPFTQHCRPRSILAQPPFAAASLSCRQRDGTLRYSLAPPRQAL
jgi:hypothetical protein